MELDLQPALDLQPVEASNTLDLQPVKSGNEDAPAWRAAEPKPLYKRALTAVRESLSPLLGPTEGQILAEGVDMGDGSVMYKPMGGRLASEGLFPALSHPMIAIPRVTVKRDAREILQDPMWQMMGDVPMMTPESLAAVANTAAGFAEFAESPLGLATGGIGALGKIVGSTATPRVIAGAYAADIASKTPEAARQAGELSVTGTPQEAIESIIGLGVNIALPGMLGAHALAPGNVQRPASNIQAPKAPEVFSEFGSEAKTSEVANAPAESLTGKNAPTVEGNKPPARADQPAGGLDLQPVETAPAQTTVPELPATLHAQVIKMQEGRAPAVLFTPADAVPEWILKDQRFDLVETSEGKVVYDTAAWTKDEITRLVDNNQMGTILGYGVPNRPAQATGAVVVRDKAGLELRAVGVDETTAPAVLEAAKRYAGEGDTVAIEPLDNVIAKRLDKTGAGADVRTVDAAAQGEAYRLARAEREAAAVAERERLAQAAAAPQSAIRNPQSAIEVTEAHLEQAREAVAQMRGEQTERAPDIFDDLDNVTKQPLRVPAELQDAVNASRERIAQELHRKPWQRLSSAQRKAIDRQLRVSTTEGMAADEVIPGLGEKYAGISVDDLANAVLDAGEGRLLERKKGDSAEVRAMAEEIAKAESEAGRANEVVDDWDTAASVAQAEARSWESALDSLKLDTNGQLHAFGLLPEAWNTLIDIAKLAVRSGRKLGEAIDYAIEQIKQKYPGALTDEAGARAQLMVEVPTRATGEKIATSGIISDEVKLAIQEYIYDPRSNLKDSEQATGIIMQHGVDAAIQLWRNPPDWMPGAVKSKLLGAITRHLANAERAATDAATKAALVEQQRALWDEALPRITNVAQELQAMNDLVLMSPDAHVARAKRDVAKAGETEIERHKGETDAMRQALNEGRAAGVEAVKQDPATNAAAREAVNEAIKDSEETKRAIVMELAQPWASSEYVLNHAREAVRAKANELLNTQPRPPQFTPAQHLRQILDDLAKRAADIFAGHIQGAEPSVPLLNKLMDRLGLDRPQAVKLASSLSKEWDRQLDLARKNLDTRLANARARQERREREAESNAAVDRALRRQLRDMNLKLGDAIRQAAGTRSATGETIADRIVQASGLTGPKAEALRARLQARWNELVAEAQRNALAAIESRSGVKVTRKMREAFDRLVELDRLAPVDGDAFFKAVRGALKLPELTEAQAKELRELILEAQRKPEGWQQQRVIAKALTLVEQAKGDLAWHDVPFSIWYGNIFSAPPTHLANMLGNSMKAVEIIGLNALRNPTQLPATLRAFARGMESGGLEAANVLLTGNVEGTRLGKAEAARPLEARIAKGGFNKALLPWAVVGRFLAAEDVLFFKAHEEVKWQMLARRVAKEEGLRGEQLDARVQDLLHNTRAEYEAAKVTAASEGLSGLDLLRRAHELIEQARERDMVGSTDQARQFGLEHTFNAQPYGVMGALADVLNNMNRKLVVTRFAVPVVRIMANLANESLNYFPPVGLARITIPRFRSDIVQRAGGDLDALNHATTRALVGTVLFGGLAALAYQGVDDPDAPVQITGMGPRNKNQREQLRPTGWKPNAIKLGDRWYSYQESHLSIPLAILGNASDAIKYKGLSEQDALNRVAYTSQMLLNTIFEQRMLSGVHDLLAVLDDQGNGKELGNLLARSGSSFIVPNAARFVDQVFDPAVYEADDVKAAIYAQTPFVRRLNRPALNAMGEPVERSATDRFTSPVKPDALMKVIAQKNAWIPMPQLDAQTVGNARLGPDYLRPMSPDEYYTWIAESGPAIRQRLTDNLDKLTTMTDDEAKAYVRQVTDEERTKAKPKR